MRRRTKRTFVSTQALGKGQLKVLESSDTNKSWSDGNSGLAERDDEKTTHILSNLHPQTHPHFLSLCQHRLFHPQTKANPQARQFLCNNLLPTSKGTETRRSRIPPPPSQPPPNTSSSRRNSSKASPPRRFPEHQRTPASYAGRTSWVLGNPIPCGKMNSDNGPERRKSASGTRLVSLYGLSPRLTQGD